MMTIAEFERLNKVRVIRKDQLLLMRVVAVLFSVMPAFRGGRFLTHWCTTYRLPWNRVPIIAYGTASMYDDFMAPELRLLRIHELVHADDMRTLFQLIKMALLFTVFPLPVLFSGRWYIERWAYLSDIREGVLTPEKAAKRLWTCYGWPWPRRWMVRWFRREMRNA